MRRKGSFLGVLLIAVITQVSWVSAQEPEGDAPAASGEAKPADAKPAEAKPDEAKPDEVKPEEAKPDEVKPEEVKPEEAKPEEVKPEEAKPDEAKPEEAKPDEAKPEEAMPVEVAAPPIAVIPLPSVVEPLAPIDYNKARKDPTWDNYVVWPVIDTLAINFTLWNISLLGSERFPNISARSLDKNFTHGWSWDDNQFEVNQFAHPWQGGQYFTTGRVNNLGFWTSSLYSAFGSVQWEMMMETESPSVPDFWMTTFGGMLLGEVLFRVSNLVVDESNTSATRGWWELFGTLLSPINALDRAYDGRLNEAGPPPIHIPYEFSVRFGIGSIPLGLGPEFSEWTATWNAEMRLEYGDIFAKEKITTPYEEFDGTFGLQWNLGDNPVVGANIDGTGVLYGWRFGENKNWVFGFFQNYEFFTNGTAQIFDREAVDGIYSLGQTSMGPGFRYFTNLGRFRLDADFKLMPIILGAITSPWAIPEAERNYNYGVGGTSRFTLKLKDKRWGYLKTEAHRYTMKVVNGASGTESLGVWNNSLFFNIKGGHGVLLNAMMYDRESFYDDYDDIIEHFWVGRVSYRKEW